MKLLHLSPTNIVNESRIRRFNSSLFEFSKNYNKSILIGQIGFYSAKSDNKIYPKTSEPSVSTFLILSDRFNFQPRKLSKTINLFYKAIITMLCIARFKPNVLVIHHYGFVWFALISKIIFGSIIIYEAHELEIGDARPYLSRFSLLLSEFILSWVSSYLIVVNYASSLAYEALYNFQKIIIIANIPFKSSILTIIEPISYSEIRTIRDDCNLSQNDFLIVYIGAFQKGRCLEESINLIIKLKKRIPDLHFCLLGYGPLQNELEKYSNTYNFIHILPPVPDENLSHYLATADMSLVLASKSCLNDYLCLPNKFFQSVDAYLPIASYAGIEVSNNILSYGLGVTLHDLDNEGRLLDFIKDIKRKNFKPKRESFDELMNSYSSSCQYQKLWHFILK